jgi:hypothetical protein
MPSCRFSTDAEKAANKAVASSQGLVDQLRIVQLAALDVAPKEVKDSQWYKDFRNGVNNFNATGGKPLLFQHGACAATLAVINRSAVPNIVITRSTDGCLISRMALAKVRSIAVRLEADYTEAWPPG